MIDWDIVSADGIPVFPASFVEEIVFSSARILGSFVKNQMAVVVCFCISIFYSIPLVFMSVFCVSNMLFLLP
jgi:hypothetical protein